MCLHPSHDKGDIAMFVLPGANQEPGAEIGPFKSMDNLNQSWDFEFIDDNPWGSAEAARDPSMNS